MSKEICTVCGREIDSRGMSGHMKTHVSKEDDTDGVISYPSNEQKIEKTDTVVDLDVSQGKQITNNVMTVSKQGKPVKKPVKKPAASKPASSSTSKPDPRGQRKTETEHKKEWQGLFRD